LPDNELNIVYNACDIGINTSVREGWGLVSFEHGGYGRGADCAQPHGLRGAVGRQRDADRDRPPTRPAAAGEWCLNEARLNRKRGRDARVALSDAALRARMAQKA